MLEVMSHKDYAAQVARSAANELKTRFGIDQQALPPEKLTTGLVLGTGWGDTLALDDLHTMEFSEMQGFRDLANFGGIEGHSRTVLYGTMEGVPVIALKGRIHLNESQDPRLQDMVRLQIAMLMELGVQKLIVTSAVGSLVSDIRVADIVIVDGFMTLFAPPMPMFGGEFCSPEDALGNDLMGLAYRVGNEVYDETDSDVSLCGHAMVRGPFFEGRKYDKGFLAHTGAGVVGMSALPEASVVAAYRELYGKGAARALCLGFVTNSATEEHSHEENVRRAKLSKGLLGEFLRRIVLDTANL